MGTERTVSVDPDYMVKSIPHKYQIYYITQKGNETSKEYDSYEEAFNKALNFAMNVKYYDRISDDVRNKVLNSIHIFDTLEERDVTTAELKNRIQEIMKDR